MSNQKLEDETKSSLRSSYYGKAENIVESDEHLKDMASRLIGRVNLNELDKDLLRDYE